MVARLTSGVQAGAGGGAARDSHTWSTLPRHSLDTHRDTDRDYWVVARHGATIARQCLGMGSADFGTGLSAWTARFNKRRISL